MSRSSKAINHAGRRFFARAVLKVAPGCLWLLLNGMNAGAQTPGGVSASLSAWFKANTQVGNVLPDNNQGTPVNEWKSELGNLSVTQATASYMPLFVASYSTATNFNFNPSLQFAASQVKGLVNTSSALDLLSNNGTYFLVLNTYRETGYTSSTCFSYISPGTGARYQAKADFRVQTGTSPGFGYIADLNPAATSLNPAGIPVINYSTQSAIVLTSRSAGSAFRCRRNADTTVLGSDAIYYPAVGSGLGIGFSAPGNGEASSSAIAEVITYNATLSDADVNKVETYLAIKYGITLSQGTTFTLPIGPTNYTLSDGTIAWNAGANIGYGHNITGIGRDDGSALAQLQSKSVQDSAMVYLYNGPTGGVFPAMNKDNTNSFAADKSVLLAGDNGLDRNLAVCLYNGKMARMNRTWKVQATGTVNTVAVAVNTTDVDASVKNLLVSTDPLFPAASTTIYPLQASGGKLYAELVFNNNEYFTFASDSLKVQMTVVQPTCLQPNGGSISTSITGGIAPYTYSWTTTPVQTGGSAQGLPGGNYAVTVTNTYGCAAIFPVTLATPPVPVINAAGSATSICPGTPVTLNASAVSGVVNTLTWNPGGQTGNSITVTPADTTTYSVIGDAGNGCADTVYVTINVKPLPSPAFNISPDTVCIGTTQTVTYTGGAPAPASYDWNNFAGAAVQSGSGSGPYGIVFSSPGTYTIQLQVTRDGCTSAINADKTVVSAQPVAAFISTPDVNVPVEVRLATYTFTNLSQNATSYQWAFGDGGTSVTADPVYQYSQPGNYTVTLYATTNGCTDSISHQYYTVIPDKTLDIPNAFSPNGDGVNDRWEIKALSGYPDCTVDVFNRWGQSVYSSKGYRSPWDGSYKGSTLPLGTYYYVITAAPGSRPYKGWVVLLK